MTGALWLARKLAPGLLRHVVRPLGMVLPPGVFFTLAGPFLAAASALDLAYAGPTFAELGRLPASLRSRRGALAWSLALWHGRTRLRQAKLVCQWSDRLATPRWRGLCRIEGAGSSLAVVGAGTRPVILVTFHFGPLELLYYWFRSHGVRIAWLAADGEACRPPHRRRLLRDCDRANGMEAVPRFFTPGQLPEAADFLKSNGVLLVVATGGSGRALEVRDGDVTLPLASGALRLASMVDSTVVPCWILAGPRGAMTITLGDPLPPADVQDRRRHGEVCRRLLRFFLPPLRTSPAQADAWLLRRLGPAAGPGD